MLPKPAYTAELGKNRVRAQVDVRVVTDTNGNVISAEVIRGPSEFHRSAIEAAMQAKFAPMKLSGQPVKTSGWLSFIFGPF
ncbi:MAG TPA: energy transducer TonB [Pyrinomonadaceae bacterium]|nr:energy transducer TonB [Pyrinomonadaceae bacterium]